MLVSAESRDGLGLCGAAVLDRFAEALCAAGLTLAERRLASVEDVRQSGSSWAKRLGIPACRSAWLLVARRPEVAVHQDATGRVEGDALVAQEGAAKLDAGA